MYWKQIADQLAQALRDLYDNGENCPDDKVLRARDAYDAAVAQDNQYLSAEDAAEQWLRSTARLAGPHGVQEEQEHLMRLGYENGYRDAVALDAPDTRVEELERTVAAWKEVAAESISPDSPYEVKVYHKIRIENRVAELLKENERAKSN